ncbi:MAG: hypothetical protein QOH25_947 [Acidobacteriota bacterium]|jgi:hypothetical protein|nr:hypothetical protein [Acidobacteriota bacterium]
MNQKQIRTLVFTLLLFVLSAAPALSQVIYDSTVNPQPGNLPSVGAEAYAFKELGDAITFAGTARIAKNVTVTMSSWGCQAGAWFSANCVTAPGATFSIPITLNIYNAGSPTPGSLIATVTQTFAIPYRPSSDNNNCTGGKWFQSSTATCFNGLANNITFDLTSLNILLPNSVVYGITYNTTSYGPNPIGTSAACFSTAAGCPYDSLNIALAPIVTAGSKPYLDTLYWNNVFASNYCDSGLAGTNTFRLDSPTSACWAGLIPAAQFTAYTIAATKDGCKNGGWQSLARAGGSTFKNQGDCQQYVNTGK